MISGICFKILWSGVESTWEYSWLYKITHELIIVKSWAMGTWGFLMPFSLLLTCLMFLIIKSVLKSSIFRQKVFNRTSRKYSYGTWYTNEMLSWFGFHELEIQLMINGLVLLRLSISFTMRKQLFGKLKNQDSKSWISVKKASTVSHKISRQSVHLVLKMQDLCSWLNIVLQVSSFH